MIFQGKYLDLTLPVYITSTFAIASIPTTATAQLIPDNTLGTESSVVTPQNLQQFLIEGGATRDSNLFHSFSEFNINNGQQVNFVNPEGIANILTRVTGGNSSNIFGALGVNGNANLFLINPNGIIFGEGANININGSFFASTADSINFTDGKSFSAVNPEASPLLTVSIPIGVQLGINPESIQAQQTNINAQDVTLIGGDINLEQTTINAPGGEVWLGSLADGGKVNFDAEFPIDMIRGDINIRDRSFIRIISDGGGDIKIDAANFTLSDSEILGGIAEQQGTTNSVAGDIYLKATENIVLNNSNINNNLELNSLGNSGTVEIETTNLTLNDSRIVSDTKSTGNAGSIIVNAANKLEVFSSPENAESQSFKNRKGLFSLVTSDATGNGGNIEVVTSEVNLSGLGGIDSSTVGEGNAGTVNIQSDRVTITEGAGVFANGRGIGDGGEIFISATEFIEISDRQIPNTTSEGRILPGGIVADVGIDARSNGGNINLKTGRLSVTNGAIITTDTKGLGNAGNINIIAEDLVEVVGRNETNFPSQIVSAVRKNSAGEGGDIFVETNDLSVSDGATINVGTQNIGTGGDLSILASGTVEVKGVSPLGFPSRLLAQVGQEATGEGGDIFLSAGNLTIANGGQISASTLGIGRGGQVEVNARDKISISGFTSIVDESTNPGLSSFIQDSSGTFFPSGIYASSPGVGNADALSIKTGSLTLSDQAQISVSSQLQGAAGNLSIDANTIKLNNSILSAETIEGERANILLTAPDIQLRNHSLITTNARKIATGGNINIDTKTLVAFENSDITANAEDNFGGQVTIDAQGIFGIGVQDFPTPQSDITASSKLGAEFSGVVEITTPDADPTVGAIALPDNFIDASQQIATSCNLDRENSFFITGKGGLPPSPYEALGSTSVLQDWRISINDEQSAINYQQLATNNEPSNIIEAQTWIFNRKGIVELVSHSALVKGDRWINAMKCNSN